MELKPCPFCGERVHLWKCEPYIHRYPDFNYCVVCNDCDLLFGFDEDYGGIFKTEEEAIEAWNKRNPKAVEPHYNVRTNWYECGSCLHSMTSGMHCRGELIPAYKVGFCAKCGQAVKWNA